MLRSLLVVMFVLGSIGLGADLAHLAYSAAHIARTVVLAPISA